MKAFNNYLFTENKEDINDLMAENVIKHNKPIIVFGCGAGGRAATDLILKNGRTVDAFCEGEKYWYEDKTFLGKKVYNVNKIHKVYNVASIIVAATGPDVIDMIKRISGYGDYSIYSYVDRKQLYDMDTEWVLEHKNELVDSYDLLNDDISKIVFLSYIGARANCINREVMMPLIQLWTSKQYFNDLYPTERFEYHTLIDCGAWIGDTAQGFIDYMAFKGIEADVYVRAFEMEDDNFRELQKVAEKNKNIECFKCGVGAKHELMYFEKKGDASVLVDYPTDNKIEIIPVDDILKGDNSKASLVKMDIEGFERYALEGMQKLIYNSMPMLAICVYHKIDDLIVIPQIIKEIDLKARKEKGIGYKYYLRHHSHNAAELVFYAVPFTL